MLTQRYYTILIVDDLQDNKELTTELEATLQSYYDNSSMMMGVVELTDNDIIHIYDNGATCDFKGTAPNSTTHI